MKLGPEGLVLSAIAIVVAIVAFMYFGKELISKQLSALMPNKGAPTALQTGTTASGDPIVGSEVKYVNPALCALTGKFCDPNEGLPAEADYYGKIPTTSELNAILTKFKALNMPVDDPYHNPDVIGSMPNYEYAAKITTELNQGKTISSIDVQWAKLYEPSLYNMIIASHAQGANM